jgi:hypothetical protein
MPMMTRTRFVDIGRPSKAIILLHICPSGKRGDRGGGAPNRVDDSVRTLSDRVGEQIAAGRRAQERRAATLKRGA